MSLLLELRYPDATYLLAFEHDDDALATALAYAAHGVESMTYPLAGVYPAGQRPTVIPAGQLSLFED